MLALVFQYLLSGSHVMVSHRASATHHAPLHDAHRILDLMPAVLMVRLLGVLVFSEGFNEVVWNDV